MSSTGVLVSMTATTAITYIDAYADPKKTVTIKPLIGGFVGTAVLMAVATWSDQVATMFALLILLNSLLTNGTDLFNIIVKATGQSPLPTAERRQ